MQINAYLNFNGRCAEAFRFYEKALGGRIETMMTFGESPMAAQAPENWQKAIMHARLVVGDAVLMGSDAPSDRFQQPQGFSVSLQTKDVTEAERVFAALSEGAEVQMPLQQTFWAARFGMLVDRFGIPWMLNCEQPART